MSRPQIEDFIPLPVTLTKDVNKVREWFRLGDVPESEVVLSVFASGTFTPEYQMAITTNKGKTETVNMPHWTYPVQGQPTCVWPYYRPLIFLALRSMDYEAFGWEIDFIPNHQYCKCLLWLIRFLLGGAKRARMSNDFSSLMRGLMGGSGNMYCEMTSNFGKRICLAWGTKPDEAFFYPMVETTWLSNFTKVNKNPTIINPINAVFRKSNKELHESFDEIMRRAKEDGRLVERTGKDVPQPMRITNTGSIAPVRDVSTARSDTLIVNNFSQSGYEHLNETILDMAPPDNRSLAPARQSMASAHPGNLFTFNQSQAPTSQSMARAQSGNPFSFSQSQVPSSQSMMNANAPSSALNNYNNNNNSFPQGFQGNPILISNSIAPSVYNMPANNSSHNHSSSMTNYNGLNVEGGQHSLINFVNPDNTNLAEVDSNMRRLGSELKTFEANQARNNFGISNSLNMMVNRIEGLSNIQEATKAFAEHVGRSHTQAVSEIREMQERVEEGRLDIEEVIEYVRDLETKMKEGTSATDSDIQKAFTQLEGLAQAINSSLQQNRTNKAENDQALAKFRSTMSQFNRQFQSWETDIDHWKMETALVNEEVQSKVSKLHSDMQSLKTKLATAENGNMKEIAGIVDAFKEVQTLRKELAGMEELKRKISSNADASVARSLHHQQTLDRQAEEIERLKNQIAVLTETTKNLTKKTISIDTQSHHVQHIEDVHYLAAAADQQHHQQHPGYTQYAAPSNQTPSEYTFGDEDDEEGELGYEEGVAGYGNNRPAGLNSDSRQNRFEIPNRIHDYLQGNVTQSGPLMLRQVPTSGSNDMDMGKLAPVVKRDEFDPYRVITWFTYKNDGDIAAQAKAVSEKLKSIFIPPRSPPESVAYFQCLDRLKHNFTWMLARTAQLQQSGGTVLMPDTNIIIRDVTELHALHTLKSLTHVRQIIPAPGTMSVTSAHAPPVAQLMTDLSNEAFRRQLTKEHFRIHANETTTKPKKDGKGGKQQGGGKPAAKDTADESTKEEKKGQQGNAAGQRR